MQFSPLSTLILIISLSLFASPSWSQDTTQVPTIPGLDPIKEKTTNTPTDTTTDKVQVLPTESLPTKVPVFTTPRAPYKYFGSFNYAALDVPIIAKYGATVALISDPLHLWELEYMTGSFGSSIFFADIGRITDTKITLQSRAYFGGTFNLKYGLTYFNFSAKLGDDLMSNVSNNNYPSLDMVEIQAYGASFGMGNTWVFRKNIVVGVDWLTISQPLYITKKETPYLDYSTDPDDRDHVDTAANFVSYLPRVSLLQLYIGMMF